MKIFVLRLGHRLKRDERVSTHCGLVARAFGASGIIFSGQKDQNIMNSLKDITKRFGGPFSVKYEKNWMKLIRNFKGVKVHLTVYGLPLQNQINKIRKIKKDLLIIIGGEKVPAEVYTISDYNLSIGNQPHSEVAALSVFLHEYFKGKELDKKFKRSKFRIIPQERGKKLIS